MTALTERRKAGDTKPRTRETSFISVICAARTGVSRFQYNREADQPILGGH